MKNFICLACGTQFAETEKPSRACSGSGPSRSSRSASGAWWERVIWINAEEKVNQSVARYLRALSAGRQAPGRTECYSVVRCSLRRTARSDLPDEFVYFRHCAARKLQRRRLLRCDGVTPRPPRRTLRQREPGSVARAPVFAKECCRARPGIRPRRSKDKSYDRIRGRGGSA